MHAAEIRLDEIEMSRLVERWFSETLSWQG